MTSHRRLFTFSIGAALLAAPAFAAAEKKSEGGDPYVKLANVGLPIVDRGRVVNYIFVSVRLNLTPKANITELRDKEPYFRDALIRKGHVESFALPNKLDTLDEERFKRVMMPEFARISGPGMIQSIEILSQSPKKLMK